MSGSNGIKQTPWDNPPVPTPGGSGYAGIGGGLESDPGGNGIQNSPYDKPACPTPGLEATAGDSDLPNAPTFTTFDDNIAPGTSFDPGQAGMKAQNTIDRK